jgi:hypothetical protein
MPASDAFEDFYRLEHSRVLASMTAVAGSLDLARDVTDEAFARARSRLAAMVADDVQPCLEGLHD